MSVAHVTSSASHASGSNSVNQASFSWTHTTTTDPQGVLVLVFGGVAFANPVTSVTYDGTDVPIVAGSYAADTATELGFVAAYFLGSGVPTTNNPTVVVNRTSNTTTMWAVCATQTGAADLEPTGVVLLQNNGTIAQQSVDDGSTGAASLRYAGVYYGGATPAPAGANSTLLHSNDAGAYGWTAVRETTAGQGSRPVGCTQATSDDRAAVHLAVREVVGSAAPSTVSAVASIPAPNITTGGGGMAFTVTARHSGTSGTASAQTHTTNSATPTASSLLLVFAGVQSDSHSTAHSWQLPTGGGWTYTQIAASAMYNWETTTLYPISAAMWEAPVGGSPAAHTVTVDGWSGSLLGTYSELSCDVTGHNATTPVVQSKTGGAVVNPTSSTASGSLALDTTPTTGNLVVVGFSAGNDAVGAFTSPTIGGQAMTQLHNLTGNYTHAGLWYRVITGAESNATITCPDLGETVGDWAAVAVEIAAASSGNATATPTAVSATTAVPAVTVQAGAGVAPATASGVAAVPTPSVSVGTNATATPAVVSAVSSVPSVVAKVGSLVAAAAVVVAALVPAPSVTSGANATVTASPVSAVASVPGPTVHASAKAVPSTVAAVATIPAPVLPHRYVTAVSGNGRYFVDQNGSPILVRGDSPWSMFTDLSSSQMDFYLANRAGYGVNVLLVSMVGSVANGAPNDNGATYDGVLPFTGGDPTVFNSTYWSRMDSYIGKARDLGITLLIYPMDGWNCTFAGTVFDPGGVTNTQCQTYGNTLATRYASYPNIIWAFGGDYNEDSTINARFNACLTGIRAAGDTAPVTIQLDPEKSLSDDSTFWEPKVDWNFVYTYYVTYKGVFDGYNHTWSTGAATKPSLWSEGSYENSFDPHPGTDVVIRRSAAWALTSGSPGEFTGQEGVWNFNSDYLTRLDTTATSQLKAIRDTFEGLAWWTLVPDQSSQLVTAGRGTQITTDSVTYVGANTYVTAARAADGTLGVIYMPSASSAITVDMSKIGANPTATWVDPTNGATSTATVGSSYSHTGTNAAGGADWLLVLTGDGGTVTTTTVTGAAALPSPTLHTGTTAAPSTTAATTTVPAPSVRTGATATPAAVTATAAVPTPQLTTGAKVTASAVTGSAGVPAPAVSAGGSASAAPAAVSGTATIPTPPVATGSRAPASTATATTAIPTPGVTAGSGASVAPSSVHGATVIPAPVVQSGVAPATVAGVANIPTPVLSTSTLVTPLSVAATGAVPQPTVVTFVPLTERPFTGITERPDTGITPRP